jgi:hypothetical protein
VRSRNVDAPIFVRLPWKTRVVVRSTKRDLVERHSPRSIVARAPSSAILPLAEERLVEGDRLIVVGRLQRDHQTAARDREHRATTQHAKDAQENTHVFMSARDCSFGNPDPRERAQQERRAGDGERDAEAARRRPPTRRSTARAALAMRPKL